MGLAQALTAASFRTAGHAVGAVARRGQRRECEYAGLCQEDHPRRLPRRPEISRSASGSRRSTANSIRTCRARCAPRTPAPTMRARARVLIAAAGRVRTAGRRQRARTVFNNFTSATQALATRPTIRLGAYGVLTAGQSLAQHLNGMSASIQGLRSNAESRAWAMRSQQANRRDADRSPRSICKSGSRVPTMRRRRRCATSATARSTSFRR